MQFKALNFNSQTVASIKYGAEVCMYVSVKLVKQTWKLGCPYISWVGNFRVNPRLHTVSFRSVEYRIDIVKL